MSSVTAAAAGTNQYSSLDEKIASRRKMKQKTEDDDEDDDGDNDEAMDVDEGEISSSDERQLKQGKVQHLCLNWLIGFNSTREGCTGSASSWFRVF